MTIGDGIIPTNVYNRVILLPAYRLAELAVLGDGNLVFVNPVAVQINLVLRQFIFLFSFNTTMELPVCSEPIYWRFERSVMTGFR